MLRDYSLLCQCSWLGPEASADTSGELDGGGDLRDVKSPSSGRLFSSSLSSESPKRWLLSYHIILVFAISKLPNIHAGISGLFLNATGYNPPITVET